MPINTASIDPKEVEQFSKIADLWWDDSGPFWPLHVLNNVRLKWIRSELSLPNTAKPLEGMSVLDVGCGGGILSESLAKLGASVTAIDVVERNINVAKLHAQQAHHTIDYQLTTAEDLAQTAAQFDVVFNMEVVEHVADLKQFMAAGCTLVKPQGHMFVATINRNWLAWLVAIFGAETVLRWLPKGTHRYSLLRTPEEINQQLLHNNLTVTSRTGVRVNPLTKSMALTRFTGINYMLHARKA
ncbi:bifunctional 2-polyprenyl-6-hydroxyphenol methylase/3-demethylubiquinol 3-O-methyltransferase UbiG [Halioxenophilus aromaticivorans]|uniref:Ubiquinone biosynthesis O-methyltransferase n=1 Tax=Halioxenophilus aromaticivorans TaxID=1306992 RepID=A0AAV3U4H8_9ALTE